MIFFNVPVKAAHTHIIVKDWLRNVFMKTTSKHENAKFSFVYFSYQPDFDYLLLSIKSLVKSVDDELIRNVVLFVDQKAPFSEKECAALIQACPKLIFEKVDNFSWASTETTMAEIYSFKKVFDLTQPEDFIVKIDSDIVMFRNNKLPRLLKSKYQAIGDGHHLNYQYAQGGLYMFRQYLGKELFQNISESTIKQCESQCGSVGEDMVLSTLFANNNTPFYLSRLMLFPDEYKLISGLNSFLRWEFCAGHFVKDNDAMAEYDEKFNL